MNEGLGFLTAIYRDGRVHIGSKSYAAGTFAVHLLNQYYKNDTAARIAVFRQNNWNVQEQLAAGYLNETDFVKAREEIQLILKTLPKLKPFSSLDIATEKQCIAALFTAENAVAIQDYFRRRAAVARQDQDVIYLGNLTYREQHTVAKHLGFCDTCWATKKAALIGGEIKYRPIKPIPFGEISHSASRKSDKASERTFYTAIEKMRKYIEENDDYV